MSSKFQKRHYEAIAAVLAQSHVKEATIISFILMFEHDNYNFDRNRFRGRIAGLKSPAN
jgi:hypothetical protein|tara:strand:- start:1361 stop:1537 length:177 start_codon:yes stop_codon:yes gene_type:complete